MPQPEPVGSVRTEMHRLCKIMLDPKVRSLYQFEVEHADEADEIFSTLMGDVVEPRRDFIQTNALKVVNLDL